MLVFTIFNLICKYKTHMNNITATVGYSKIQQIQAFKILKNGIKFGTEEDDAQVRLLSSLAPELRPG